MKSSVGPRGQRRGFYWQDLYSSWLFLRARANPSERIKGIAVEARGAPHVDDVVIHRPDRVEYQQLKHVENRAFTGADLFAARKGEFSLLQKLHRGWASLGGNKSHTIEVRLVTNAKASRRAGNYPTPAELERSVRFLQDNPRSALSSPDKRLVARVAKHIDRGEAETKRWLKVLHFTWKAPDVDLLKPAITRMLTDLVLTSASRMDADIDALAGRVYDLATASPGGDVLDSDAIDREIRRALGVQRVRLHDVVALPDRHVPRRAFANRVLREARALRQGYLRVLGPPGCGKTTLATWLLERADSEEILCCYYIFDPSKPSDLERYERVRGRSLILQVSQAIRARYPAMPLRCPGPDRTADALDALWSDLQQLGSQRQRIVMIDGIDHVVRARAATDAQALFGALRRKPPTGVVFLLLGQPDWNYPSWLAQTPHLDVPPFARAETRHLVVDSLGWSTNDVVGHAVADRLHGMTEGNPLSLFLNIQALAHCPSARSAEAEIPRLRLFGPRPMDAYAQLLDDAWAAIAVGSDSLRKDIGAWLAVAELPFDAEHLHKAFAHDLTSRQAEDILQRLRPLLVRQGERYRLFHDDFRRFILEGNKDKDLLQQAHSRHASALLACWKGGDVGALAEHLWQSGRWTELDAMPAEHDLLAWLDLSTPRDLERMLRMALAASFALARDQGILGNALRYARLAQVEPSVTREELDGSPIRTLSEWSHVVPPATIDGTLKLRASALEAAAGSVAQDPKLAAEIASRFSLDFALPADSPKLNWGDVNRYLKADVSWHLRSGRGAKLARRCAGSTRAAQGVRQGLQEVLEDEGDPATVDGWLTSLGRGLSSASRQVAAAAWKHFVGGRSLLASTLVRRLLRSPAPVNPHDERDAVVLAHLLHAKDGDPQARLLRAPISLDSYRAELEPSEWRHVVFHAYVTARLSRTPSIDALPLPLWIQDFLQEQRALGHRAIGYASGLWRVGLLAGLVQRRPDLVSEAELRATCDWLLETTHGPLSQEQGFRIASRVYIVVLAHSVSDAPGLRIMLHDAVLPLATSALLEASDVAEALREAVWVLDPASWRALATRALAGETLPPSSPAGRARWHSYWSARAKDRGLEIAPAVQRLGRVARLGVDYEKQDLAGLAMDLLERVVRARLDPQAHICEMAALLARVHREEEGPRGARRHLPSLLALSLKESPRLFEALLRQLCLAEDVEGPFEELIGLVVVEYLRILGDTVSATDLVPLWRAVACAPEGFKSWGSGDDDSVGSDALTKVAERLEAVGSTEELDELRRWLDALRERRVMRGQRSPTRAASKLGFEEVAFRIDEIKVRWFSPYGREHRFLQQYVSAGGDGAWRAVCAALAPQVAEGIAPWEAQAVVDYLIDIHAPRGDELRALHRIAVADLDFMLRFQPPVQIDGAVPHTDREPIGAALIRLMAEGLVLTHAETVRACLRALSSLARRPAFAKEVEASMLALVARDDDRLTGWALLVLRELPSLSDDARARLGSVATHANAWCRWLACAALGTTPGWQPRVVALAPRHLVAPDVGPVETRPGRLTFSDPAGIRENYVNRLTSVTSIEETVLRSEIAVAAREVRPAEGRPAWDIDDGRHLVSHATGDAVARAFSALASEVPDLVRPVVFAHLAPADPWLLAAPPVVDPPKGWVELAFAQETSGEKHHRLHRSLGLVHPGTLKEATAAGNETLLAEIAARQLCPDAPDYYAWISERWDPVPGPVMGEGPVIPLSFLNKPFSCLARSDFFLVPRWDDPIWTPLTYGRVDRPRWCTGDGHPVIVAARRESGRLEERDDSGIHESSWSTSWWAEPTWLAGIVARSPATLIRFWRVESSTPRQETPVLTYGLEPVQLKT